VTKVEKNGRIEYLFEEQPMDLHRDVCDRIVLYKDGKEFHRVPEVLDCWMDSGSVPFAEHHYPFEHKDEFEQAFPADFIIEYVGQVRAWFNVLLRVSTMIFDQRPFTNVICTGVLAGNDGRKMSKSFGNYPDPKTVLETIGGEALRLYMMGSVIMVGGDMNWSDELLNEQVKNILIPLWNTYKYLTIYTDLHNWTPEHAHYTSSHVLDTWLHSYMNKVTFEYAKALEAYNYPESVKVIQPAIDTLSTWWIRRSRDRFVAGDAEALQTLYAALVQLTLTFAPQMPFVTEEMYQNLVVGVLPDARESVHLEDYPEVDSSTINEQLLADMNLVRRASSLGQNLRVANGLKLRQPLARAYVNLENPELQAIVRDEINVKEVVAVGEVVQAEGVVFNNEEEVFVGLETTITPALREEGLLAELKRQLQNFRKNSGLKMGQKVAFHVSTDSEEIKDVVKRNSEELSQEVSAKTISIVESNEGKSIKVEEYELVVTFRE
ncbi:MAG: class I tRNA ligase family protein, partial [Candidatus Dojkabacteria bacterium]